MDQTVLFYLNIAFFSSLAPQFINCPMHYIEAYVGKTNRVAELGNLSLIAEDYEGKHLSVSFLHAELTYTFLVLTKDPFS